MSGALPLPKTCRRPDFSPLPARILAARRQKRILQTIGRVFPHNVDYRNVSAIAHSTRKQKAVAQAVEADHAASLRERRPVAFRSSLAGTGSCSRQA
jgi:predicted subunit of tRNA(5-methylaminomethyl-2-thiouridylate) methyltransferase